MAAKKSGYGIAYDHIGIPTNERSEKEHYSPEMQAHFWRCSDDGLRIEKIRFDADVSLPDEIKNRPHIAFKVDSLEDAIRGKQIVVPPSVHKPGIQFAYVEVEGILIEFFQIGESSPPMQP